MLVGELHIGIELNRSQPRGLAITLTGVTYVRVKMSYSLFKLDCIITCA